MINHEKLAQAYMQKYGNKLRWEMISGDSPRTVSHCMKNQIWNEQSDLLSLLVNQVDIEKIINIIERELKV